MDIVAGKNIVEAALLSGAKINKIIQDKNAKSIFFDNVAKMAEEAGVTYEYADSKSLKELYRKEGHQGIIAYVESFKYVSPEDIIEIAHKKNESPFIILLDHIEDTHNFGAVLRTAEAAGAHGVIIAKKRAASVTEAVYRTSAGAAFYMPVAAVTNISEAVTKLKKNGLWVYGLDVRGTTMYGENLTGGAALVIGGENTGLSPLVAKKCDAIVSIPMYGKISSLNASVSAGIAIYEIIRQRIGNGK